jgi:hypothetical protein
VRRNVDQRHSDDISESNNDGGGRSEPVLTDCEDERDERGNQSDRPDSEKLRLKSAALPDMIEIVDQDHDEESPIQRSKVSFPHEPAPVLTSAEVSIRQSDTRAFVDDIYEEASVGYGQEALASGQFAFGIGGWLEVPSRPAGTRIEQQRRRSPRRPIR